MKIFTAVILAGIVLTTLSCNVYHSGASSIDEAVRSENRVRVVTADNVFYEFKQLKKEEGKVIGVAGKDSYTTKMLLQRPHIIEGKDVKFFFEEGEILEVYLKNKKMSNIISFGVPVAGAVGLLGVTSEGFKPNVGY